MYPHAAKIKKAIDQSKTIALFGHTSPDGDCIGAMLGLGRMLEKQGKQVSYITPNQPNKGYNFLSGFEQIKTKMDGKKYDLLMFIDFSAYDRIEALTNGNMPYFVNHKLIVIDHHPEPELPKHALRMRDTKAQSTSEIIFEQAQKWRKKYIDKEVATCFYLGLLSDSGNFVFDEDHERIFQNALGLVRYGADKNLVVNNIMRKKSIQQLQFLGLLTRRIKIQGNILYSYYDEKDLKKYKLDREEAGYGLITLQNIAGPQITLILRRTEGKVHGSIRAKDALDGTGKGHNNIDCNKLAQLFGGGGHKGASGFTTTTHGSFTSQIKEIVKKIGKELHE